MKAWKKVLEDKAGKGETEVVFGEYGVLLHRLERGVGGIES